MVLYVFLQKNLGVWTLNFEKKKFETKFGLLFK